MSLIALSKGRPVVGTIFRADNHRMHSESQIGSGACRPHLIIEIVGSVAKCCALSKSSDAWNAEVSPHFVPRELNDDVLRFNDSLFAVNRWVKSGKLEAFDVSFIRSQKRFNAPIQFVQMAIDLRDAFANDLRSGRLPKRSATKFKNQRLRESIKRIQLTTVDVMKDLYPDWHY
jgi:hypothetical protein